MKAEIFRFIDDSLSDDPDEVFENIVECMPLGETLIQIEVSLNEVVYISGYAKVRVTRTDEEVEDLKKTIADIQKKQHMADLSSKYLSL